MPAEPQVPDAPAHLLATLREPRRLRILLALEHRPRSAIDLVGDLGLTYPEVHWALKQLAKGGLVAVSPDTQPTRQGRGADMVRVYVTSHAGWAAVLRALQAVAATSRESD
jgi:DNA-binding transcriptional ArsR family regulator